jgi:hypothetical protein
MRIAWLFVLLACIGWAQGWQNTDIVWMFGGLTSSSSVVQGTNSVLSGSAGVATQTNFGYQVASTKAGNLWIEVPVTFTWLGVGTITGTTIASIDRDAFYFTPGVRLKTPSLGRVSFYGAAGGGTGSLSKTTSSISGANGSVVVNSNVKVVGVFDFAGGIDLRLSRMLSLRAEARDFVSAAHLGGVAGHNHPVYLVGFAFHY